MVGVVWGSLGKVFFVEVVTKPVTTAAENQPIAANHSK